MNYLFAVIWKKPPPIFNTKQNKTEKGKTARDLQENTPVLPAIVEQIGHYHEQQHPKPRSNQPRPFDFRRFIHNNPMRRQCQFTVQWSERSVDLTVAPEQQPCGVQVVEGVGLVAGGFCITVQFSAPILLFFSIHKNIGHLNR